jgi:uncharacterized repeat protein (TIGR02543 family)
MKKRYVPVLFLSALVLILVAVSCKTVEVPAEYNITYVLDGGAWNQNLFVPATYTAGGEGYNIPDPVKRGYDFAGWLVATADGTIVARGSKSHVIDTSLNSDITMAARWEPVKYTLSYSESIVELTEPEPVVEVPEGPIFRTTYTVEDLDFILPEPEPKQGLDFLGWKEKSEDRNPNTKYLVLTSRAVDYYFEAIWTYHTYSITYDLAGGEWEEDAEPETSFIMTDGKIRIPAPYRQDYDFVGWKVKDSEEEPSRHYSVDSADCTDIVLEAVWEPHYYSIKLVYTEAKGDRTTLYYTILDEPFLLPEAERDGYTFAGWYAEDSDEEPSLSYMFDTAAGGNYVFRAAWTPLVYHIEYELGGGYLPFDLENPDTYTIETDSFTLIEPYKDNYVFLGWIISGDRELTLNNPLRIRRGTTGDIKLYAIFQWKSVELGDVTSMQQMLPELGANGIPRPNWVVKVPADDYWHYEKGYATADTFYEALNLATKKALLAVAEWCGTDAYEYYFNSGTEGFDDLYIDTGSRVVGREIAEYWEDADGGVWVLLRVPADSKGEEFSYSLFDSYDDYDYDYDYDYEDFDWFSSDDTGEDDSDGYGLLDLLNLLFGE